MSTSACRSESYSRPAGWNNARLPVSFFCRELSLCTYFGKLLPLKKCALFSKSIPFSSKKKSREDTMATMAEESFEFRVDQGIAFALASLQNSGLDALANVPIPQNMIEAATITTSNDVSTPTTEEASLELGKTGCSPGTDPSATVATKMDNSVVDGDDQEIDAEKKLARSRERNREHARKTRMRKKAQLEALQSKVKGLEAERQVLKQKVEECGVASILLGLSAGANDIGLLGDRKENEESEVSRAASPDVVAILSGTKRKRFISEAIGEQSEIPQQQSLTINIDGQITEIGSGKSHINWKTGVYKDQGGVQKQLTPEQLADLRYVISQEHPFLTHHLNFTQSFFYSFLDFPDVKEIECTPK